MADFTPIPSPAEPEQLTLERYAAVSTVTLGEVMQYGGFAWRTDSFWAVPELNTDDRTRVFEKIENHYLYRELAFRTYNRWAHEFMRTVHEIAPKYARIYALLSDGFDPLTIGGRYGKSRDIRSDFPQTLLSGNSDYASDGTDREFEEYETGDMIERVDAYYKRWQDTDLAFINELEKLFSPFFSANVNAY